MKNSNALVKMSGEEQAFFSKFNDLSSLAESWVFDASKDSPPNSALNSVCSYSLLAGGKRLRPTLALAVAEMLGVDFDKVRQFAIALEFIHTFSLIHDDLPSMDDDDLRRGKPTAHIAFGEAAALLAGDALLAKSFYLIGKDENINAEQSRRLSTLLSEAVLELGDGQLIDLEEVGKGAKGLRSLPGGMSAAKALEQRHLKKTAALIRAAVSGPYYLIDNVSVAEKESLEAYGNALGLLFQITDDLLEVTSTSEELGKSSGSDIRQGTPTYVSVHGEERAREMAVQSANTARQSIERFGRKAEYLQWLTAYVLDRRN